MTCVFDKAWIGKCEEPADDTGYCEEHKNVKCVSCGKKATRECDHTGIQFVCGYPLCDNCTHGHVKKSESSGWFALGGGHCSKAKAEADFIADLTPEEREELGV